MKDKNFKKMLYAFLDGEATLEEELLLEKECRANRQLAGEKESLEEVVSLLRQSDKVPAPAWFTEKVMDRVKKSPVSFRRRILDWIRAPLDLHLNWGVKWAMVFVPVLLIWTGAHRQHSQMQSLYTQVGRLEQMVANLKTQPVAARFILYSPAAKTVHLVGAFNNWQAQEQYQLLNLDGKGTWSTTIKLKPGQYEYMFLVDGENWVSDPGAMNFYDDGFGHKNSVVEVTREIEI